MCITLQPSPQYLQVDCQVVDASKWNPAVFKGAVKKEATTPLDIAHGHSLRVRIYTSGLSQAPAASHTSPHKVSSKDETLSSFSSHKSLCSTTIPNNQEDPSPRLLIVAHNLAADIWSFELLLRQLAEAYHHFATSTAGPPAAPPPGPEFHYLDFMAYEKVLARPCYPSPNPLSRRRAFNCKGCVFWSTAPRSWAVSGSVPCHALPQRFLFLFSINDSSDSDI